MQQIDFSALGNVAEKPRKPFTWLRVTKWVFLGIVVLIFWTLLVNVLSEAGPAILAIGFLIIMSLGVWKAYSFNAKRLAAVHAFATANGWAWGNKVPPNELLSSKGVTFSGSLVDGTLDGQRFWMHSMTMSSRDGPGSYEVLSIEVPKPLPTLLILPPTGAITLLADQSAKADFGVVPLHLEGNFDTEARAYCEPDQEAEALEYLTPDVMDVISQNSTKIILYAGQNMYVSPGASFEMSTVPTTFKHAQQLLKEIKEKQHVS